MATENVAQPDEQQECEAPLKGWLDEEWDNSGYPGGVRNRLKNIDLAARSIASISELLTRDRMARFHAQDEDAKYKTVQPIDVDGLESARDYLAQHLVRLMEDMREAVRVHGNGLLR